MVVWEAISGRKSVSLFHFFVLLDEKREGFVLWRGLLSCFLCLMFLSYNIKVWDTVFHTSRIINLNCIDCFTIL